MVGQGLRHQNPSDRMDTAVTLLSGIRFMMELVLGHRREQAIAAELVSRLG